MWVADLQTLHSATVFVCLSHDHLLSALIQTHMVQLWAVHIVFRHESGTTYASMEVERLYYQSGMESISGTVLIGRRPFDIQIDIQRLQVIA